MLGLFQSCQHNVSFTGTTLSSQRILIARRSLAPWCVRGVSPARRRRSPRKDACLLRGNTLDLKRFLCPQYLWHIGLVQPSLNSICPEPADTGYNGDIDVLLRNPWVGIKELLASRQGQRGSVWTQDNVFLQSTTAVALLARCTKKKKKKKTFHVRPHAKFMHSSQSNMLDNMLGLSVKDSCCAVVFPCGVCWGYVCLSQNWDDISFI